MRVVSPRRVKQTYLTGQQHDCEQAKQADGDSSSEWLRRRRHDIHDGHERFVEQADDDGPDHEVNKQPDDCDHAPCLFL